jgi:hypothetical protein
MDMSYAWVLLLKVAHRKLTVYVTRYGVRAHNVVHGTLQRSHCSFVASVVEKVNVYLPSLMMKVPNHLYVLGDT